MNDSMILHFSVNDSKNECRLALLLQFMNVKNMERQKFKLEVYTVSLLDDCRSDQASILPLCGLISANST